MATTPTTPMPLTLIAPPAAPFYLAVGAVDSFGGTPDGSTAIDFIGNTGRFIVRSAATNLAEIELIGGSNAADGRQVSYLVFGEYSGPGSASGYINVPLEVNGNLTADGTIVAKGFADLNITFSHTRIGVADDLATPMLLMLNASAPTDQKNWVFAALEDSFVFSAATDTGGDFFWMVANRSGTTITDVTFTPPVTAPYFVANSIVGAAFPDGSIAMDYMDPVARIWGKSLGTGLATIQLIGATNDATGRNTIYLECTEPTPGNPTVGINAPLTVQANLIAQTIQTVGNLTTGSGLTCNGTASFGSGDNIFDTDGTVLFGPSYQRVAIFNPSGAIEFPGTLTVGGSPVITEDNLPAAPETTNIIGGDGNGGLVDTGIVPNDVALLDNNNIFTGAMTVQGPFSAETGIIQQLTVGINILVGNNVTINQNLSAVNGAFSTSLTSQGSPVRTFANTGTGGGPPIPATTNLLAGTGATEGFADSGIVIANVPLLNAANQTFTGSMTVQSGMTINQNGVYNSIVMGYQNTMKIGTSGGMNSITFDQYNSVFITADSYAIGSYSIIIQVPGNPVAKDRPKPKGTEDDEIEETAITISGVYFPSKGTAAEASFGIVDNTCWFPESSSIAGFLIMTLAGAPISVPYYPGNAGGGGASGPNGTVQLSDGAGGLTSTGLTSNVGGGGANLQVPGDVAIGHNSSIGGSLTVSGSLNTANLNVTSATSFNAVAGTGVLPAAPAGFVTVSINGTSMMIPFYVPAAEVSHDMIEKLKDEKGKNGQRTRRAD